MEERLKSLINALPILPDRTDGAFEQLSNLVLIAEKLGMRDAVELLTKQLNFFCKWLGPKPLHPEQRSGEVHLLNSKLDTVRYIGWKSKRAGEVAYDLDGNVVPGEVPVFVQAEEFAKSGQLTDRYSIAP